MEYRRDIDGLRAVAVLLVVGFHAFPDYIPGGFIGVDVFFVISGFLISGIIFRKLCNGQFSFIDFYSNRIRRIFPALIFVLSTCLVSGLIILYADEYSLLGKHVVAASLFVSNFVLKSEAGYFDKAAELKPLLHLWSLGVEEQFYFFWPLILFCTWRWRIPFIFYSIVITMLSFGLNLVRLDRFPSEVYYLPHARIWEFMVGALLAHFNLKNPRQKKSNTLSEIKALGGLGLVLIGTVLLNRNSPYPGYGALLPVLGAYSLISAGEQTRVNRIFLGNKAFVGIGLISYPLYLWHWPLFSFVRIIELGKPSTGVLLAAAFLSFLLAGITYQLIEKPIRHSKRSLLLCSFMLIIGIFGYYSNYKNGIVTARLARTAVAARSLISGKVGSEFISDEACILPKHLRVIWCSGDRREKPKFLLLGDSQVPALFPGLVLRSHSGERWGYLALPGYKFLQPTKWKDPEYDERYQAAIHMLIRTDLKLVVMVNNLRNLGDGNRNTSIEQDASSSSNLEGFSAIITQLEKSGKQVVFMVPTPWLSELPENCVLERPFRLSHRQPKCSIMVNDHLKMLASVREMIEELKKRHPKLLVYDPTSVLCPNGTCSILMNGKPIFGSTDHLSDFGSEVIAADLLPWIHSHVTIK